MELERIRQIVKEYKDLKAYIEDIFELVAKARGTKYTYFESFEINEAQIKVTYSEYFSGEANYDFIYFDVGLLTEDPAIIVERLKAEVEKQKMLEAKRKEEQQLKIELALRDKELATLARLQARLQEKYGKNNE